MKITLYESVINQIWIRRMEEKGVEFFYYKSNYVRQNPDSILLIRDTCG